VGQGFFCANERNPNKAVRLFFMGDSTSSRIGKFFLFRFDFLS